jgi:septum formation protein
MRIAFVSMRPLVLASASPRRADLLRAAGIAFDVRVAAVDETPGPGESPEAYVRRLSVEKARAVAAQMPARLVLGADTTVVVDGRLLGKPAGVAEATAMLRSIAGRMHEVVTGVALVSGAGESCDVARTSVWVRAMTPADIEAYVATGEPMDKAGAYAIQGRFSAFIDRVEGSYTNVVGLPVALVCRLLLRYPER